ncbi:ImmA/IrrE family metallo-endopeptidase [Cohaesibacter intestini]|uniref:ImmA/IrrE family metallo-endopeptidase n=1 Tax=Cohaesibacter intestini TaxID=2211145 RepID=UPI000DEA3E08|nr:ImmA/IrrE family metallo-endopeptidase [Cohaesibacter intestini]
MRKAPKRPIRTPVPALPDLDVDSLDTTERVIQYCIRHKLIDGVELDIERLIEKNPYLTLKKKPLPDGIDAYIKETSSNHFEIGVNSNHSRTRQRFSMAHEFAHYQLHRENLKGLEQGERILHRSDERNHLEYQANSFAAAMLMPEDYFREEVRKTQGDVAELAARFGVSSLALRYRAKNLGLKGHGV